MSNLRARGLLTLFYSPDAIDATKDFHKSIWKKVPDFRRALAFMISNGETEKRNGDANLRQLVADYIDTLCKYIIIFYNPC